jgi:hypothetical protein
MKDKKDNLQQRKQTFNTKSSKVNAMKINLNQ